MAIVIVITPMLFSSSRRPATATVHDSTTIVAPSPSTAIPGTAPANQPPVPTIGAAPSVSPSPAPTAPAAPMVAETLTVANSRAKAQFVTPGAAPLAVTINGYRNLHPKARDTAVVVQQSTGTLLRYRLAMGGDTIALDTVHFTATTNGPTTTFTSTSPAITLSYEKTDGLLTRVRGTVANAQPGAALLIDLPSNLRSNEADTLDDQRHMAYGYKIPLRDPESISFSKLEPNAVRADTGAFQWVNARNKFWIVALMQPVPPAGTTTKPVGVFHGLAMRGGARVGRVAPGAYATTTYPITNGQIAFDLYVGPQKWAELHEFGNGIENANQYASFLHPVVQPFVTIVMKVLLWMKSTTRLSYGWVLVLFGVVIRLALWPLNQRAMRTSIQMQRLQPELTEIQKRYKSEPEKQREAIMKVYQSHGMSPFSPMLGCLPMLLPMPILYALYFVFQNTIEFRGVAFLWLPDLSLRDPTYIVPIAMGLSMFLLSWIGMRQMPSNPQAKMMSYMMPVMFTAIFFNLASGLNLYYAVQNIAALPQQWMITRERAKAGLPAPSLTPAKAKGRG